MKTVRALPENLQRFANAELNEVVANIDKELELLKKWIESQPHLRARLDDQLLLAFLRSCRHDLEKAKSKVDLFYTMRTNFPDIFGVNEKNLKRAIDLLRLGVFIFLPVPLPDNGPRLAFVRVGAYAPSEFHYADVILLAQILEEIVLQEDDVATVLGLSLIVDFDNATASHLFQFTPSLLKKIAVWDEDAVPIRFKNCFIINADSSFQAIGTLLGTMLSEDLKTTVISFGRDLTEFPQVVPTKYMPREYGGENGSIDDLAKYWEEKILSYRDYFAEEVNYGTDETLRPGKPVDFESYFGVDEKYRKSEGG